jgi:hypothetical protein
VGGRLYFTGKPPGELIKQSVAPPPAADPVAQAWEAAKDTSSVAVLDFIRRFFTTLYGSTARARREELLGRQLTAIGHPERPNAHDTQQP